MQKRPLPWCGCVARLSYRVSHRKTKLSFEQCMKCMRAGVFHRGWETWRRTWWPSTTWGHRRRTTTPLSRAARSVLTTATPPRAATAPRAPTRTTARPTTPPPSSSRTAPSTAPTGCDCAAAPDLQNCPCRYHPRLPKLHCFHVKRSNLRQNAIHERQCQHE